MARTYFPQIEPLESRIAPAALAALHPLPDIVAGIGKTGATIDLGSIYDEGGSYSTHVKFITNFDADPATPGLQGNIIELELYDADTPLTVQNFLSYALNKNRSKDYDGTFFHRSADFGFGSGAGRDIIQGGGFAIPGVNHIPTGPELHNEYSDLRPNERGTIAVAKTGLSPNTGTSEWFINVNDNNSILGGTNNGGYTVFGRVVQGLDLVDQIAAQQTVNLGGAFGELPVQNYNADPDNNPSTPSPSVQFTNLIQITDAQVIQPVNGLSPGVRFEVVSVVDGATGQPTDLLSAKLTNGDTLGLKYKPGATGVAKVTVLATDAAGDTGTEEFFVTVKPNLIIHSAGDTLPDLIVPGDTGKVSVELTNNTGGAAKGQVDVKFFLSQGTDADPNANILDDGDREIGSILGKSINLASGKSLVLGANVQIPATLELEQGASFRILAQVTTPAGSTVMEAFSDDNLMLDGGVSQLFHAFGTFSAGNSTRANAELSYLDADSHLVTMSMKGTGFGQLLPDGDGGRDLSINLTNAASQLRIETALGFQTVLDDVTIFAATDSQLRPIGEIGKVLAADLNLTGDFKANAGAKSVTLGNFEGSGTSSHLFSLGQTSKSTSFRPVVKLGAVEDTQFTSAVPLASLFAAEWRNVNAVQESISLPGLGAFEVDGNLEANVSVSGTSKVDSFAVNGVLAGSTVKIAGNVGSVTLGAMDASKFLVGTSTVPAALSQFDSARTIASFIVKGTGTASGISDSSVAAHSIGSISVAGVDGASGAGEFGFYAGSVKRYQRIGVLTNLSTPGEVDEVGNYSLHILPQNAPEALG